MLDSLFSTYTIKGKTLKNRTAVPGMVMNLATTDGMCTERYIQYFETKAKGGFALVMPGSVAVRPEGRAFVQIPGLWNDEQTESWKAFTKRIHDAGTLTFAQLYHCGRQTSPQVNGGFETISASAAVDPVYGCMPHRLTVPEIHELIKDYGKAAYRAKAAGFDGIEIHAYGYLLMEFLSTTTNDRTDEYGGGIENRIRIVQEIIRECRAQTGDDYIIGVRIAAHEGIEGGRSLEETKVLIPYLEEAGVDYFNISAGCSFNTNGLMPTMHTAPGWLNNDIEQLKKIAHVPVIASSRYTDMRIADQAIAEGKADLVAFGRASIVDPEAPNKAQAGDFEGIRTCLGCLKGCMFQIFMQKQGGCVLNPRTGNEVDYPEVVKAETPKRVMVIGAGPAGASAAIEAAKSGHTVDVYEKSYSAGGEMLLASIPPAKSAMRNFIRWQVNEMNKLGVNIHFETEATEALVKEVNPDVVIYAAGASPVTPEIPGADKANVVSAFDVLAGSVAPGMNNVIIGGGAVGAETANWIGLTRGIPSTVVEMGPAIAMDEGPTLPNLLEDLAKRGVKLMTNTKVKEIADDGVVVVGADGVEQKLPADKVILAAGVKQNRELADKLIADGFDVRLIGDCSDAPHGFVADAVRGGFMLGRSL